jgi:hypothetical protein
MAESTTTAAEEPTSAFVPATSKCWGQKGSHHGLEDCCLLKTESVWADVPRVAMERAKERDMRIGWAVWRREGSERGEECIVAVVVWIIFLEGGESLKDDGTRVCVR